jgi:hypothetical protein
VLIDSTRPPARVPIPGSAKTLSPQATLLTPVTADERVGVTLRLRPQTPIPDHFTGQSRDDFEHQHAASASDIAHVVDFAKSYGLDVSSVSATERSIALTGSAD